MTTNPLTTRRMPATHHVTRRPIVAALGLFGTLAIIKGAWGLAAPESLIGTAEVLFTTPALRVLAVGLTWTAFFALAAYVTIRWETLQWWEELAGWALVLWIWLGGMLLVYVPPAEQAALVALAREHAATVRVASQLGLAAGLVLLATGLAIWLGRPAPPRPQRRLRPRIVHHTHPA
jgi:hypothetical protein